jgi:hypothetical protein
VEAINKPRSNLLTFMPGGGERQAGNIFLPASTGRFRMVHRGGAENAEEEKKIISANSVVVRKN